LLLSANRQEWATNGGELFLNACQNNFTRIGKVRRKAKPAG
jgi:hypothetical protein